MSSGRRFGGAGLRRGIRTPSAAVAEAAGWVPSDDASVERWWRADLGRTMVSTKCSAWLDQVEGVSVTQGTDTKRPTVATHAGQDALVFAGGQCLRGSGFVSLANPSWSAVVVGEMDSAGASEVFVDDGDSNTNNWLIWRAGATGWRGNAGTNLTTTAVAQTGLHAHWLVANSSSSAYYIDDFGTARVTGNAGTSANESMTVGATHSDSLYLTGKVCEIIIVDGVTLPSDLAAYLTARYTGLTVTT